MGCGSSSPSGEKYKIISTLGSGASCSVFKVREGTSKKFYALKKLPKADTISKSLWDHEKNILSKLNNKNVLQMVEAYDEKDHFCIVTVMCEGGELFDKVSAMEGREFTEQVAARFTRQLLLGLEYSHRQNVTHRDLKPENYVFVDKSENSDLQLIDFGCAVHCADDELVKDTCGSPYYIAPEVLSREWEPKRTGAVWRMSDMWSIGVCVFLLVTGRPPFYAQSNKQIFAKIQTGQFKMPKALSNSCKDFLTKLLQMKPENRLTAIAALNHPWLSANGASATPLEQVSANLGQFQKATRLRKAVANAFSKKMSVEEKNKYKKMFEDLDVDKDGHLSTEELSTMMTRLGKQQNEVDMIMKALDNDGNDEVDLAEFTAGMMEQSIDSKMSFETFDVDKDGNLSLEEMAQHLSHLSGPEVAALLKEVDTNKDGFISFDEWQAAMGSNVVHQKIKEAGGKQ